MPIGTASPLSQISVLKTAATRLPSFTASWKISLLQPCHGSLPCRMRWSEVAVRLIFLTAALDNE